VTQLPQGAAIVVLGPSAIALARRLQSILPDASVHALAAKGMVADRLFTDPTDHLAALFRAGIPIVGLCAAGILIRAVATLLGDKRAEPPLVAVAADGSSAVPLLGGHQGGLASRRRGGASPIPSAPSRSPRRCSPARLLRLAWKPVPRSG
jgi:cobalt-precorrin 5A hydrolase/precorrin-3B C17-methyltransferase